MKYLFTTALVTAAFALPLAATAQERYPTLNPDQLSPAQKAYVDGLQKPPRNNTTALKNPPFKVYLRSPELAAKLEAVSDYVRWGSGQPPRLTELAIMITARQWSSQWIWRGHYRGAVRGGLDPSVGADIAAGKRPEKMKEDETILYNYATEMYRDKAVSDATYAAAVKAFGEKGLIDLVARNAGAPPVQQSAGADIFRRIHQYVDLAADIRREVRDGFFVRNVERNDLDALLRPQQLLAGERPPRFGNTDKDRLRARGLQRSDGFLADRAAAVGHEHAPELRISRHFSPLPVIRHVRSLFLW